MPSPYPLIYIPPHLPQGKPRHCPHYEAVALEDGHGPDEAGGGIVWGGLYDPDERELWVETKAGWWIRWEDPSPQQLVRLQPSPQIERWHWIAGAQPQHRWRVPVILTPANDEPDTPWNPACSRLWNGEGYELPEDLDQVQRQLLMVALGLRLVDGTDDEAIAANNTALRNLSISLLGLGHHASEAEMVLGRWLDDRLIQDAIHTALDRPPVEDRHAPQARRIAQELGAHAG